MRALREKSKESGVHRSLDDYMEHTDIEVLDNFFREAGRIVEQIEEIRDKVVDDRDDVFEDSGSCCYKTPDLMKSLNSILWKVSADNKGDLSKANLMPSQEIPFFEFKGHKADDSNDAITEFCTYIKSVATLYENVQELTEKAQTLTTGLESMKDAPEQVKDKFSDNPFKIPGVLSKLTRNTNKVKAAIEVASLLPKEMAKMMDEVKNIAETVKDKDKMKKCDEYGEKAHKNNWKSIYEVVWNNLSAEERTATLMEGKHRYSKKRLDKKKRKDEKAKKKHK
jgi:hypothetical protein